jgi:hypothetical protein
VAVLYRRGVLSSLGWACHYGASHPTAFSRPSLGRLSDGQHSFAVVKSVGVSAVNLSRQALGESGVRRRERIMESVHPSSVRISSLVIIFIAESSSLSLPAPLYSSSLISNVVLEQVITRTLDGGRCLASVSSILRAPNPPSGSEHSFVGLAFHSASNYPPTIDLSSASMARARRN